MKDNKVTINAEKFAFKFMDAFLSKNEKSEDIQRATKEALAVYLTAYYVVKDFNNLESSFFNEKNRKKNVSSYQRILSELNKY
ncbi:hypothetical protein [Staphylococcus arlettae]|uniref:hypothetical protein n=1 Tax=Staphylococcus TaxID=1279 RepID=UPI000E6915D1|nr:hypothetical protein [Staphylococcus arlettae]RIM60495.1 hypothetical protein BU603_00625 [Staphylococcus arlettae]